MRSHQLRGRWSRLGAVLLMAAAFLLAGGTTASASTYGDRYPSGCKTDPNSNSTTGFDSMCWVSTSLNYKSIAATGIQVMLKGEDGSNIAADGVFGQATKNAVFYFQSIYGLTPDGVVGTQTYHALRSTLVLTLVDPIPSPNGTAGAYYYYSQNYASNDMEFINQLLPVVRIHWNVICIDGVGASFSTAAPWGRPQCR